MHLFSTYQTDPIVAHMGSVRGRLVLVLVSLLLLQCVSAQQDDALVRDFEKLSAKERARIAKEEQEASMNDKAYQAIMVEAEVHFRELRFEESMSKFKEARVLRPYNVYPKVKIKDLEVLIAKRDAEIALAKVVAGNVVHEATVETSNSEVEIRPASTPLVEPILGSPSSKAIVPETVAPVPTVRSIPEKVSERKPPAAVLVEKTEPVVKEGERVYKEGRSVVLENSVVQNGRMVVYRKVFHPWGAVDHFRDGTSIPDHVYNEAMDPR